MKDEIIKECSVEYKDENLIKVLINICKYYKINKVEEIIKYIKIFNKI